MVPEGQLVGYNAAIKYLTLGSSYGTPHALEPRAVQRHGIVSGSEVPIANGIQ